MNRHFQNAQFFYQQNRISEAETELKKSLSENPNDAFSLGLFAACRITQKDFPKAVELAKKAVSFQPYNPNLFYILGRAYFYNQDIPKARHAISEGQRIAPDEASFFLLRGEIEYYSENWEVALKEVNQGLELDSGDVQLVNLRARCLVKLNRQEEASQTLDYALNRAPENTYAHANKGWVAIEKDEYDKAIEHFRQALRFDPTNDYAKAGLKEAIKGKNYLYRGVLKYFLWMDKMQEKYRWGFIIGIYILYQIMIWAHDNFPILAPILLPLIIFYILFAFSTWIAQPVSNLFLRLHPVGKYALSADEILATNIVSLLAVGSLTCIGIFFFTQSEFYLIAGGYFGLLMIPTGGTFSLPSESKSRNYMILYSFALAGIGAIWFFVPTMELILVFALGIFLFGWVANYLMTVEAKKF